MDYTRIQTMYIVFNQNNSPGWETVSFNKKDAIKKWIEGSGHPWSYWRRKYGHRCYKVQITTTIQ